LLKELVARCRGRKCKRHSRFFRQEDKTPFLNNVWNQKRKQC
jgi:hypothetical protein